MEEARGRILSPGSAMGQVHIYRRATGENTIASGNSALEQKVFLLAIEEARLELAAMENEVMEAQAMFLEDASFVEFVCDKILREKLSAYLALEQARFYFAETLCSRHDAYIMERIDDFYDVIFRLQRILSGEQSENLKFSKDTILISEDLTPSEVMNCLKGRVVGIVSYKGSTTAHAAILARTHHLPGIMGIQPVEDWEGHTAIMDANNGMLIIDPSSEDIEQFRANVEERKNLAEKRIASLEEYRGLPTVTRDGRRIALLANVGSIEDVEEAYAKDAEGIGLFRTEFLFLDRDSSPSEEEQYEIYRRAVELSHGKRVVFRTMDIGADKKVAYLQNEYEQNPALGLRGIRLSLQRPEIFLMQIRALLRAAAVGDGNVSVMLPMIADLEEIRRYRELEAEAVQSLEAAGIPYRRYPLGIMIETPAAVLSGEQLAEYVDFFSIGTNDLTQYVLAIDRENASVEEFMNPRHEAVIRMIHMAVLSGHRHGIPVGICGELAGDYAMTETFLQMEVDDLSVIPASVLGLRKKIRETVS